ncbi:MAG: hypothetical protein PHU23_19265 [Dehalococcoidales bacterium]|nr:hypothetical protein [Dehalococcoidales bacterium]
MTPVAVCPKCGIEYVGWALKEQKYRYCPECGSELEITEVRDVT